MWIKFGAADIHIHVSSDACYVKTGAKEAVFWWGGGETVNEIQSKVSKFTVRFWQNSVQKIDT
jgi:hypothetical protein